MELSGEPVVTLQFVSDPEEVARAAAGHTKLMRKRRRALRLATVCYAAFVVIGVLVQSLTLIIVGTLGGALMLVVGSKRFVHRALSRGYRKVPALRGPTVQRFGPDGLYVSTTTTTSTMHWSAFESWTDAGSGIVLLIAGGQLIVWVPKRAAASPDEWARVVDVVSRNLAPTFA